MSAVAYAQLVLTVLKVLCIPNRAYLERTIIYWLKQIVLIVHLAIFVLEIHQTMLLAILIVRVVIIVQAKLLLPHNTHARLAPLTTSRREHHFPIVFLPRPVIMSVALESPQLPVNALLVTTALWERPPAHRRVVRRIAQLAEPVLLDKSVLLGPEFLCRVGAGSIVPALLVLKLGRVSLATTVNR